MKYLMKLESLAPQDFDDNRVMAESLVVGQMYRYRDREACFIGNNGAGLFSLLFLVFNNDIDYSLKYYKFIEWASWCRFTSLDINLKDYIIRNNLVGITLNSFNKEKFQSGPSGSSLDMIRSFNNSLLEDEDILMCIDMEKYKL